MDIGWEGVVFLWVVFLWPVLLASAYLIWKKKIISKKSKFFFVSVVVGYVLLLVGNFFGPVLLFAILKANGTIVIGPGDETLVDILTAIIMVTLLLLPVFSTHYIAKRFS